MTDDLTIPKEPDQAPQNDDGPIGNPPPRCEVCGAINCKQIHDGGL